MRSTFNNGTVTTQGFCADANLAFISNEGIELTGTVNRNSNVVINVMKNGYLWNEETALGAKSEGIVYYDAVVTNDEGKYSFLIGS